MTRFVFFGCLLLLFASCQREEKVVFIQFDDSEGLHQDNQVLLNGVGVGTVLEVDLTTDYKVLVKVHLSDSLDFPDDSQFEIQSQDLFTKMILVTIGESVTTIKSGDTIQGIRTVNLNEQVSGESSTPDLVNDVKEMLRN